MDDLKDDMNSVLLVVKKEKILPLLPPKRTQFDLVVKPPASCKRKPSDAWDLENLGTYEALRRFISFSQSVSAFPYLILLLTFHLSSFSSGC